MMHTALPCQLALQEDEQYQEGKLRFTGGRGEQATYGPGDDDDAEIQARQCTAFSSKPAEGVPAFVPPFCSAPPCSPACVLRPCLVACPPSACAPWALPCPIPHLMCRLPWEERHLPPAASAADRTRCINLYRICRLPLTARRGGGMLRARMRRVSGAPAACGACLARLASAAQAGPPVPAGPAAVGPTNLVALCQRGLRRPRAAAAQTLPRSADEAVDDDEEREPSPAGGAGRGGRGGPAAGLESAAGALGQQASVAWLKGVAVVGRSRIYSILCSTGR